MTEKFQYILCYGSTPVKSSFTKKSSVISIHPMLRFNPIFEEANDPFTKFQYILCYGSTVYYGACDGNEREFQYILCYGSTPTRATTQARRKNFNTSYVTVQPTVKRRIYQISRISIHPMLRFNPFPKWELLNVIKFQYILCYGSTYDDSMLHGKSTIFQYILCYGSTGLIICSSRNNSIFQYILCYGSTKSGTQGVCFKKNFNTSYVTVQLGYGNGYVYVKEFQYILCYGSTTSSRAQTERL